MATPRIPPLAPEEWNDGQRQRLAPAFEAARRYNISATLARHPAAYEKFVRWTGHFLDNGTCTLSPRERELLILRTTWLCRARYPWAQHVAIAQDAGLLSQADVVRVQQGAGAEGWSAADTDLLRAADDLHRDFVVSDATWASLSEHYDTRQLMDIAFVVGHYTLVSMATRSFGIELDRNLPADSWT
jgi:4-carboxymuconolactone decarboxylase